MEELIRKGNLSKRKSPEIFIFKGFRPSINLFIYLFPLDQRGVSKSTMKRSSRRASVAWNINNLSPKPTRSETLPTPNLVQINETKTIPFNANNQQRGSVSVQRLPSAKFHSSIVDQSKKEIHRQSISLSKYSSMKSIQENSIEPIQRKTSINQIRPVTVNRIRKSFIQSEYSSNEPKTNKEFTPLYSTTTDPNQLDISPRAAKYHFRSTKDLENIHRFVSFVH